MEREMPHIVYTERAESKRRIIRTDGALYVLVLLGAFGVIFLSRALEAALKVERLYLQLGMYAALFGVSYLIYRTRLVDYVYELYDTELRVLQAVGEKKKLLTTVPLDAITEVGTYRKTDARPTLRTFHGEREKTTAIWFTQDGKPSVLCLNATDAMREKLSEAIHAKN
jgi:hypothetical protein